MLEDRISRIALAISLLLHVALAAPLWERWSPIAAGSAPALPPPPDPLAFRLVDPQPGPEATPSEPTPNVSDADRRAAQPDAPSELPLGEAFRAGESPLPTTARPAGGRSGAAPSAAARPSAARPEPAARPADRPTGGRNAPAAKDANRPLAEARDAEPEEPTPPAEPGRTDPRLALGPSGIAARTAQEPDRPPGSRLPVPEVDQRLTRAEAGSDFSLNTTAWEWAPYMQRLKARIEDHIAPPAAFYYGTAAWISRVRFRIGPDGRLLDIRLLGHRGVENLQYVALDAVTGAADYEPLPPGFPEPYLEVTGSFYFNVFPPDDR